MTKRRENISSSVEEVKSRLTYFQHIYIPKPTNVQFYSVGPFVARPACLSVCLRLHVCVGTTLVLTVSRTLWARFYCTTNSASKKEEAEVERKSVSS